MNFLDPLERVCDPQEKEKLLRAKALLGSQPGGVIGSILFVMEVSARYFAKFPVEIDKSTAAFSVAFKQGIEQMRQTERESLQKRHLLYGIAYASVFFSSLFLIILSFFFRVHLSDMAKIRYLEDRGVHLSITTSQGKTFLRVDPAPRDVVQSDSNVELDYPELKSSK